MFALIRRLKPFSYLLPPWTLELRGIDDEARKRLLAYLGPEALASITAEDEAVVTKYETPEVDVYLHLLVMIYLLDQNNMEQV